MPKTMPDREAIRRALSRYLETPGARAFQAMGLSPAGITLLGFALCLAAAGLAGAAGLTGAGWLLAAAGLVFLVGGGLDMFDGALARMSGRATPFGALLDSVFDRLGEAALFVGLAFYAIHAGFTPGFQTFYLIIIILALVFSQGVSYLRARGEGLGAFTRDGLMTRAERVPVLGISLAVDGATTFDLMPWVLLVIALISCFTLFQRMFTIRALLNQDR